MVTYYLVQLEKETDREMFEKLVSSVNAVAGVGVDRETGVKDQVEIFYAEGPHRAKISLVDEEVSQKLKEHGLPKRRIVLECEKVDLLSVQILREFSAPLEFRVFSPALGYFLPADLGLVDCLTGINPENEKASALLIKYGLKPIFHQIGTYSYYALSESDGKVHFVNDNLVYHLLRLELPTKIQTSELSYPVAESVEDFVTKYDVDLIPKHFYQYYGKSLKIINYSGFNIDNPGRKVFIKPYILELSDTKQRFFKIAWDQASLLHLDKIRKGESLDDAIRRILGEELKVARDYIGAAVARVVEYDLDMENKLTPRLVVRIFIEKAQMTEEQREKKDRTWISYDQVKKG